jgi:hypothetical protein
MIARTGECETAEYHLFLLIIDIRLLQLAQCELAGGGSTVGTPRLGSVVGNAHVGPVCTFCSD